MTIDQDPTQPTVAVLSGDLFFGMRIRTTLSHLDYTATLTKDADAFLTAIPEARLGIVDFNAGADWDALAPAIGGDVPVIAFGAHTDVDGFRAAKGAGVARVISNGEFSRTLPDLIDRYALTSES